MSNKADYYNNKITSLVKQKGGGYKDCWQYDYYTLCAETAEDSWYHSAWLLGIVAVFVMMPVFRLTAMLRG